MKVGSSILPDDQYESHDDEPNENLMRPDVVALRRKLGMEV